jgi:hypothetical protein
MATTCCAAGNDGVYPFKGRLDVVEGVLECSLQTAGGQIQLNVEREPDGYKAFLDVQDLHTPFFDMTTQLQGVVRAEKNNTGDDVFSGRFESQHTKLNGRSVAGIVASVDFSHGTIRLIDLTGSGVRAFGQFGVAHPYPFKARIELNNVDVIELLNALARRDKPWDGNGEISGDIQLSGDPHKIALKANLVSQNGFIEQLPYDLLSLNAQGIYPLIDLTSSTVTKTDGFSVGLSGFIDLSDRAHMASQITAIKRIPLIKDNVLRSEWVFKTVEDPDGEGKTETQFFLKNDKRRVLSGQEDSSLLGVQKKIGF